MSVLLLLHSVAMFFYDLDIILDLQIGLEGLSKEDIKQLKGKGISFNQELSDVDPLGTFGPKLLGAFIAILLIVNQSQEDRACRISEEQKRYLLSISVQLITLASCVE